MLSLGSPREVAYLIIPSDGLLGLILRVLFRVTAYSERFWTGIALVRAVPHSERLFVFPTSEPSYIRRIRLGVFVTYELCQLGGMVNPACFRVTALRDFFFHGNESPSCQRIFSVRGGDRYSVRATPRFPRWSVILSLTARLLRGLDLGDRNRRLH